MIELKIMDINHELKKIHFLYDCKAYQKGYEPTKNFETYTKYLRNEVAKFIQTGQNYDVRGFILFSSKFRFRESELEKKILSDASLKKFSIILFEANALKILYENASLYEDFMLHFPWEVLIDLKKSVIHVNDNNISKHITTTMQGYDKQKFMTM